MAEKSLKNMNIDKATQEKIVQLQLAEQNLTNFALQRQQIQAQIAEVENALAELKNTDKAFKIIGSVMIQADKQELQKELQDKKELLELRVKSIEKQESKLKEKVQQLQQEVLKKIQ
ncbi:prefoldin subunit beta [Candidatus Woesearchaeota archaeon]|nr:prefoldin subunit beta [Candidatus Woesearchaeota archaeon]